MRQLQLKLVKRDLHYAADHHARSERAQQEIDHLTRLANDARLEPTERAGALLIAHQRRDVGSCLCGWDELGKSHAAHQADMLAKSNLLFAADHLTRLAAGTENP